MYRVEEANSFYQRNGGKCEVTPGSEATECIQIQAEDVQNPNDFSKIRITRRRNGETTHT